MKLGKQPATLDRRDLQLIHYETGALTAAPVGYGHQKLVSMWGMLGNDEWGDCAIAGPAHETMLWTAAAGRRVAFTTDSVLAVYSAVTGFNPDAGPPGANPTDQGSNVRAVLNYRRTTGMLAADGSRHRIAGYTALEPGNWGQLLEALYVFEAVGVGIQVPSSAMGQFQAGKPWTVVAGASIEGGHYIPIIGRPGNRMAACVTWGAVQQLTQAFYEKYCDEAWAILTTEDLAGGKTLEGLDLAQLQQDLAAL